MNEWIFDWAGDYISIDSQFKIDYIFVAWVERVGDYARASFEKEINEAERSLGASRADRWKGQVETRLLN